MMERIFVSAKSGIVAFLCVLFAQVGAASYSVQVTAGQDRDKGTVSVVKRPGSGSQADSSVSVFLSSEGESAVISAVPAQGYKFDRWTLDMIGGGVDATYLYEAEHTVNYSDYSSVAGLSIVQCLAAFSGNDVAVNLNANTGSGHVSPSRVACVFGDAYPALPVPTATGLKFVAWYDAPSGGNLVAPGETVVADSREHTLYAYWEAMKFTVAFDPGDGTVEPGAKSMTVTYADKYPTMPVPVLDRYDFVGWFTAPVGGKEVSAGDEVTITEDATFYARWQIKESEIEYTITLDGSGATKPGTRSVILKRHSRIEGIVLPERTGYAFAGYWSAPEASGVCYVKSDGSPDRGWDGTADATIYAAWTPNTYKVHYFPNGGVGSVVTTNVQYDTSFKLAGNIFSRFDGATFAGWRRSDGSGEYAGGAEVVNLAASGSVCLLAVWKPLADERNASGICVDLVVTTSAGEQAWRVKEAAGVSCLRSGGLSQGKPSELRTLVSGPGTVSFSWCAEGTAENTGFQLGDGTGFSRIDFSGPLGVGNWQKVTKTVDRAAYVGSGGILVWKTSLYREYPSETIIDHTLYVKDVVWKPSGYSRVVFNLNDGGAATFGGGDSMTVPHGAKYGDIPDPVRGDRMFVGWTTNGVATGVVNPATTVVLPADHELTALWDVEHMGALVPDASFAGADITYDYDGSGHTINISALDAAFRSYSGVTFAYSMSRTGPWTPTPPEQTRPGSLVTYCQAFAEGYDSYSTSAVVRVVCQSKVVVKVTGRSKTVPYDGTVKTLSGYDVDIADGYGLYSTSDFSFSGVSSLAESDVGVYRYGLSPRQFANRNDSFKDVVFEIVADGRLEIEPVAELTVKERVVRLNRGTAVDDKYGAYFSLLSDRIVKSATASGFPAGVSFRKVSEGFALAGAPTQTGAFNATLMFTLSDGTCLSDGIRFLVDDGAGRWTLVPADGFAGADVTAKYDGAAHTIAADAVAAAFSAYDGAKVEYSAAVSGPWSSTPPAQTEPGSLATYYIVSSEGYDPVTNSATVTVTRKYMVTLDPGAGRLAGDDVIVVEHGGTYPEFPEPTRDRYDFQGWFTSATGGTRISAGDAVDLPSDATLHARWQIKAAEIEYAITLDGCGATTQGAAGLIAKTGSELGGISLPRRTGYVFAGYWSEPNGAGTCYISADGLAVNKWSGASDETIYAAWTPNVYKVYYLPNGGFGEAFSTNVEYDAVFRLAENVFAPSAGMSAFSGWLFADGSVMNAGSEVSNLVASGSICLRAAWEPLDDPLNASGVCDNLSVTTAVNTAQAWSVVSSDDRACLMSGIPESGMPSELRTQVPGPGTLSFSWCVTGTVAVSMRLWAGSSNPGLYEFTNETAFAKWANLTIVVSQSDLKDTSNVCWRVTHNNKYQPFSDYPRFLFLRDVLWVPNGYYKVEFDLAEGGAGAAFAGGERMTVKEGQHYGDLPDPEWAGHVFQGWTTNGVASGKIDPVTTTVLPADHTLTALWADREAVALVPAAGYPSADVEYGYNGSGRTINVNALAAAFSAYDGVSFTYSNSSDGPWSITPPVLNGLGSLTTYIKASADGYDDFVTSAVVRVVHDAKVLVKITGPSAMYDYDGSVKRLSGFEVEIEDEYGLYTVNDFAFNGVSNLTESAIGEYFYGLKPEQFANLNQDFSNIVFRIVADGHLAIQPAPVKPLVPADGFDGADAEFAYDGTGGRAINTNALAAAFPGATLAYAASPDGPWTAAPPELWGLGSLVTYVKASADGYSDFVTSAVVKVVCDSPVAVRVSGPLKTCYFDGDEKTLSGFDIEISGGYGLYSVHAFRFDGVSNLTETAVGEYAYGLKPGQFINLDADFTKVSFEIKSDGTLVILPGPEVNFVDSTFDLELNKLVDSGYGAYFTITSDRPVASGVARGLPAGVSLIRREGGNFVLSGAPSKTGSFEATLEFVLDDGTGFSGAATFRVESHEVKPKHLVPAAGFSGADADYDYDGAAHTIDTNALAAAFAAYGGVKLEYSALPTGPWSTVAPAFAGPGSLVVYCRASADGYDTFSTSAVVRVVCSARVTVRVTGPSKTYFCDGKAKTLSGFDVEIVDHNGLYAVDDFSFSGRSNLVATAAGVYTYGLKSAQFVNRNADFSDVAFEIVSDGRLEIVRQDVLDIPEPSVVVARGVAVDSAYGAYFTVFSGSPVKSASAKGLPAGVEMVATADGYVFSGIPTKAGVYDAALEFTLADGTGLSGSIRLCVDDGSGKMLVEAFAGEGGLPLGANGTVSGSGFYALRKKVTLKAKAARGGVFAGWYVDPEFTQPVEGDYRAKSLKVVAASHVRVYARFVTAAEDASPSVVCADEYEFPVGEPVSIPLDVRSFSACKLTMKGAPKGLKLVRDKKADTWTISGTPKKAATATARITVKNATNKSGVVREVRFIVGQSGGGNTIVISPVVETGAGAGVPLAGGATLKFSVGIAQRISLGVVGQEGVATTLKAKGLPSGLKLVKTKTVDASGVAVMAYAIEGVPKKAQAAKQVVLTATNRSKWKGEFSFNIEVAALPAAAVGTYGGFATAADGAESTGAFTLKLTSAGKVTGNFNLGGKRVAFKAMSLDRIEETTGGFVVKIAYKLNGVQYVDDEILIALDPDEGVYCAALLSSPSGVLADAVAYRGR